MANREGRLAAPAAAPEKTEKSGQPDPLTIGRRLRHLRQEAGRTLSDVAEAVDMSPSALSLIENGKREPRLSVLAALATELGVALADVLATAPPSRRAALEIKLERAQRSPAYKSSGLPMVRVGPRLPTEALEALVGMHEAVAQACSEHAATPEHARRANAALRARMRAADNYFGDIESEAAKLVRDAGHGGGPVSRTAVDRMAAHLGYTLVHTSDLPASTRTVSDTENRRIYLPQPETGQHDARLLALQALGHIVLEHSAPADYAQFLEQRVEINYFAAAAMMPEKELGERLQQAKAAKDISIEDLRDHFGVSYETAAHRFTNLATKVLGIPVHFMRISQDGVIYKAYENDGIVFPSDATGAIEGQHVCKHWTARVAFSQPDLSRSYQQYTDTQSGTYWCTAFVERTPSGLFSVNVGTPYQHVKWFRGRDTTERSKSRCPDPSCCTQPPAELSAKWDGRAWPSARVHSHLLAAMPPGTFPGVDDTEVYEFLERHAAARR